MAAIAATAGAQASHARVQYSPRSECRVRTVQVAGARHVEQTPPKDQFPIYPGSCRQPLATRSIPSLPDNLTRLALALGVSGRHVAVRAGQIVATHADIPTCKETAHPALGQGVSYVIGLCSVEQVRGLYAGRRVAFMAHIVDRLVVGQHERHTMRQPRTVRGHDDTVAVLVLGTTPDQAARGNSISPPEKGL